ncbi:outer membrane beta-barrel protein [Roseospira marina]|uniref:outer membrane beta-barrel protein n=1 Tax=Roseospira marina TaxID=140057 RepID=UPI001478E7D1|nr:outer membrane beta-barrel protein [Roseospira marina]MBB4315138.1 hypothetical protein [Roseospira marina]MBB5088092.1 hypothetical protein [Roseospira marina]
MKKVVSSALAVACLLAADSAVAQSLDRINDRGLDRGRAEALERYRLDRSVDRGRAQGREAERYTVSPAWSPDANRFAGRPSGRGAAQRIGGQDRDVDFTRSVGQRQRAEGLNPQGGRVGLFRVFPRLSAGGAYESNVFATDEDTKGDFVATVEPNLTVRSDWPVHSLNFGAHAVIGRHAEYTGEDYNDFGAEADGVIEIQRGTDFLWSAAYEEGHLGRGSPDDVGGGDGPRTFDRSTGYAALSRSLGVLGATVDSSITYTDFHDGETITGATINHDDDDHVVIAPGARLSYSHVAGDELYVRTRYVETIFDDPTEDGGPDRDNTGFDLIFGATKTFDAVWRGEVYAGYAPRFFDDDAMEAINGADAIVAGVSVVWNPTAQTSVLGNVRRSATATVTGTTSGISATGLGLGVEHEVTRATVVFGTVQYSYNDFIGESREDDIYELNLGADYAMNRYVSFDLGYNFTQQDSSEDGEDYEGHTIGLGVTLRY